MLRRTTTLAYSGHKDDAGEDIPEHIEIGYAGDETANDADCSHSIRGVDRTCGEGGMHIRGGVDHAEVVDACHHA